MDTNMTATNWPNNLGFDVESGYGEAEVWKLANGQLGVRTGVHGGRLSFNRWLLVPGNVDPLAAVVACRNAGWPIDRENPENHELKAFIRIEQSATLARGMRNPLAEQERERLAMIAAQVEDESVEFDCGFTPA